MSQQQLRDEFLNTLAHIGRVLTKVTQNSRPNGILSAPDSHKIAEGLFLSAWTHWEQFTHYLLLEDLATNGRSSLHRRVTQFRTAKAAWHVANQILNHPDHPERFIDWSDYGLVVSRANELLGAGNRFAATPLPRRDDLDLLKRIRNAIAHKGDRSWNSFLALCRANPFSLHPHQMRWITPGRFLMAHTWNGQPVLRDAIAMMDGAAWHLVP